MKPVRFHDAARIELLNEIRYYTGISPKLGERLAIAVEQATQLASEFPDVGTPYKYAGAREMTADEEAWAAQVERRNAELEAGSVSAVAGPEALAKLKSELK